MPEDAQKKIAEVTVDRALCIGAASCVVTAPEAFALDDENKAVVKPGHGLSDDVIRAAAESCPTRAIFLKDEDGNQIFP